MTQQWTIPLQISISIGTPTSGLATVQPTVGIVMPTRARAAATTASAPGAVEAVDTYDGKFSISSLGNTAFNWRTALSLALASRLAYSNAADVATMAKTRWGMKVCEFIEADDTQCFVAVSDDAALVSFRGTEALGDWLANLDVLTTTRTYGTVHRGFLGAFQVVAHQVADVLNRYPGRRLLLTGHSLGGALALIAAAEWRDTYQVKAIHTFGQPAVGKKDFQTFVEAKYGDDYYRFVNADDIVPKVPPFFRHAGRLIHFNDDGDVERVLGSSELEALGVDIGHVPAETPMLTPEQFYLLRAQLLQERAMKGGASLHEESVERAAQGTAAMTGMESLEGFFPSVSDHSMNLYVTKVARKAGV